MLCIGCNYIFMTSVLCFRCWRVWKEYNCETDEVSVISITFKFI